MAHKVKKQKMNLIPLLIGGIILVLLGIGVFALEKTLNKKQNGSSSAGSSPSTSSSTSHSTRPASGANQGGAINQSNQKSDSLPPSSQWITSKSGNLTLQQPSANTVVKSGDTLSGLAKVNTVQFILTDSSVGLIAQGNLSVVNGKFSGALSFTAHSNSGKLEVYYPNPNNGAEEDIIDINVKFSP